MARKKPRAWKSIQDLCEGGNLGSEVEPSPEIQNNGEQSHSTSKKK